MSIDTPPPTPSAMNKEPIMKSTTAHEDQFAPEPTPQEEEAWREMEKRQSAPVAAHAQPPKEISRTLLGVIVDEVFDGACEDTTPIEDIYRVIVREHGAQQPVSGAGGVLSDSEIEALARQHGTGGWQTLNDMIRFGRAVLAISATKTQPSGNAGELPRLPLNDPAAAYRVLHDYGQPCARAALAQEQGGKE